MKPLPIAIAAALAGCASTVSYVPANHCDGAIPAGMARIVAGRPGSAGGAIAISVHDDGQPMGRLGIGGRLCWWRLAGTAYVTAYREPAELRMAHDIDIKVAAGETAEIRITTGSPWELVRVGR